MWVGSQPAGRKLTGPSSAMLAILGVLLLGSSQAAQGWPAHGQTVPLAGNHSAADLTSFAPAAADRKLDLKIILALRNRPALDRLLAEQQDPNSPQYHHWLSPEEFAASFGPRQSDFQAAESWMKAQGFSIVSANIQNHYVEVTGTVAQVEQTFGIAIVVSGDGAHYANRSDPRVPAHFAATIAHIEGLDNLRHFVPAIRPHAQPRRSPASAISILSPFKLVSFVDVSLTANLRSSQPEAILKGSEAFGPGDVYTFYDESSILAGGINGQGADCIALIEDSNYLSAAVTLFDNTFGLASANITNVFPNPDPGLNRDELETLLDIEWAHAIAPGAALRVYIGNQNNSVIDPITDGIQAAVNDHLCSAISISFSSCGATTSFFSGTLDPIYAQGASLGQSIFVSSGDNGAAGEALGAGSCVPGTTRSVNEMGADPNVTAVGGTQFTPSFDSSGNDVGFVAEQVWDEPNARNGAGGGGVSTVFSKPAYQNGVTPADGQRDVPDVALIASPDFPGVFVGQDLARAVINCCIGGTSLAAPMWAGISRLIGQAEGARLGNMNPRIYQLGPLASSTAVGLRDVTSGTNTYNGVTGFSAGPGYDLATGWGSADIAQLVAAFPASSQSASATPVGSATATPSGPTPTPTADATVTPTPTATPTPTPTPTQTPGGVVSVQTFGGSGSLGQTVSGGRFTIANTSGATMTITDVIISFSSPLLFSSATLTATAPNHPGTARATVNLPQSTTTFTLSTPLMVPNNDLASFSLKVTISPSAMRAPGGPPRVVYAVMATPGFPGRDRNGLLPVGFGFMIVGMSLLAVGDRTRRRSIALALIALALAASAVGCNSAGPTFNLPPIPTPTLASSSQSVDRVDATGPGGATVTFSGLPASLGGVLSSI